MKLGDFKRRGDKRHQRFVTHVEDAGGDETFELTIAGPEALIQQVLEEATIELIIDSGQSDNDVKRRFDEWTAVRRKEMWTVAALDRADELFKPEPASPKQDTSVVAAVRPVEGEGTPFAITVSSFTVPAGVSFFFFGSWVFFATGAVLPLTGDQDLNLRLFGTTGTVVSRSRAGGTSLDFVWFTMPSPFGPLPFVPVFEVLGFTTGVCSNFSAQGG